MSYTSKHLLLGALILFQLTACAPRSRDIIVTLDSGAKKILPYKKTLVASFTSEPPNLDWIRSSDMTSAIVQENIMEGLTSFDLSDPDLKLQPALATNWTPEQGGKKWVFSLRRGVKWSDGVDFKVQHVVNGWQRLLNPKTASNYANYLYPIKNAKAYNEGEIKDFNQVGIRTRGDHILEVELEKPMSFFPMLLTHHSTFPFRSDLLMKHGAEWLKPSNLVTLGPYSIKFWHHDDQILLERNPSYYGRKPDVENVLFQIIGKESTAIRLFDRGKVDFVRELPTATIDRIKTRKEYHSVPGLRLYYYGFKTQKEPVNNPKVRRAIAHAIDRSELIKILGGGQLPLNSWVPQGMFGFNGNLGLKFDVEKAKLLIKEAGYGPEKPLPRITLGFNTLEKHRRVAENIQAQLKRNLGLDIELKNEEWKTYLSNLDGTSNSDYTIYRLGWVADYPDPDNFLNILAGYSANNRTGWSNENFDKYIEQGRSELNVVKRQQLYDQAQKLLIEQEIPAIPLFTDVNNVLVSQRLKNFPLNPLEKYQFKHVRIVQ